MEARARSRDHPSRPETRQTFFSRQERRRGSREGLGLRQREGHRKWSRDVVPDSNGGRARHSILLLRARNRPRATARSIIAPDLWSLAIIAYECVVGRRPHGSRAKRWEISSFQDLRVRPILSAFVERTGTAGFRRVVRQGHTSGTRRSGSNPRASSRRGFCAVAGIKEQRSGWSAWGLCRRSRVSLRRRRRLDRRRAAPEPWRRPRRSYRSHNRESLIVGATLGALLLVGGGIFLAFHSSHGAVSPEPGVAAAAAAPQSPPTTAAVATNTAAAPAPTAAPTPSVVPATAVVTHDNGATAPAPSVAHTTPQHAAPPHAPSSAGKPAKTAGMAPPAAAKPAGKQHADFVPQAPLRVQRRLEPCV